MFSAHTASGFGHPRGTILARLHHAFAARRQRASLGSLDDRLLADIGITREQALAETHRPVWDVPAHWLR